MIALYNATREGKDQKLCEQFLERNADPNFVDKDGLTPLYFACSDGNLSLVKRLIEKGANVDAKGCLQIALDMYHNDVAKLLLTNGCEVNLVSPKERFESSV